MKKTSLKKAHKPIDILIISNIAHNVWREHYSGIISSDQIEYMLDKFQSPAAIEKAIAEGYEYYLIRRLGVNIGYVGIKPHEPAGKLFLSKIYVLSENRGKGFAYDAILQLEEMCIQKRLGSIWLTVNKDNPSIARYERMGFKITDSVTTDIGGGFVMDDYIMEKKVEY